MSRLAAAGWRSTTSLHDGIERTYEWFSANYDHARGVATDAEPAAVG